MAALLGARERANEAPIDHRPAIPLSSPVEPTLTRSRRTSKGHRGQTRRFSNWDGRQRLPRWAAFWDAGSATEAAFAAQERIAAIEVEGFRPRLRTGIHLGRPRKVGGDYLGVDVNIAARLCDAAKPGEILVSDRVLLQLDPSSVTAKNRRFRAKGAPKELAAYALTRASA